MISKDFPGLEFIILKLKDSPGVSRTVGTSLKYDWVFHFYFLVLNWVTTSSHLWYMVGQRFGGNENSQRWVKRMEEGGGGGREGG